MEVFVKGALVFAKVMPGSRDGEKPQWKLQMSDETDFGNLYRDIYDKDTSHHYEVGQEVMLPVKMGVNKERGSLRIAVIGEAVKGKGKEVRV